ncbi:hypothetical protein [Acetobacter cibinongensis]|uniref:Uncharacterized protein n=1 Tax=Acetobacter cibinongensis TaxID=146475 RepID=A0A1Z5YW47_9PROT|nr:hypothetical protein [Acetobacter cibinongensis]OUJ03171.1 hypothetical protein HK14_03120 [Acetobacter cibinongensis]
MATVSVEVDVRISEHLTECSPGELAKALADYPKRQTQEAMRAAGLYDTEIDKSERANIEELITAFNEQDSILFEIAMARIYPDNWHAVSYRLAHAPKMYAQAA